MFLQSAVLIGILGTLDLLLRHRVRATLRYWIWMLVFIKLLLPPSLSAPTGIGYWMGRYIPRSMPVWWRAPEASVMSTALPTPLVMDLPALEGAGGDVTAAPDVHLTWQGGILLLWIVGVLVLAAWVMRRLRFVKGLLARAIPAEGHLLDLLDQCRRRMGLRRWVEMRLSPHLFSPAVCGLWRPTILMPAALLAELPPEKLRTVLIHELAHVRRADLWLSCLQTALQIAYFYNPLVWLANAIVRRVREQAVDEMVLVALGAEAGSYSGTLVDIAEMAFLRASSALGLVGVAESKKSLEGRIRHMVNRPIPKSARVGIVGVLVIALLGALLLPMAAAQTRTSAAESVTTQGAPELPRGIAALFGLSKDDLLAKYGQPDAIFLGENRYTLDNLPQRYFMVFDKPGLSFGMEADRVAGITLLGPAYVFGNGVRVGDSEAKVKAAFGPDYVVKESQTKDFLNYRQFDLSFEVYKPERIVREINIGRSYGRPDRSEPEGGEGRKVDPDNLSAVGKACLLYADDHEDKLPPDLQTLVKEVNLSPTSLESKRKPKDFKGPSYVYIPGQSLSMYPGNIVAYENPEFSAEGINVLFLDSHVEFLKAEAFREELRTTYERLGKPMPEAKFKD